MRQMRRRALGVWSCALIVASVWGTAGHVARAQGRAQRVSPPQPQQQQGVEYFVGAWDMIWTGRESDITPGPRTGVATFARQGSSNVLQMRAEGTIEGGGAFRESGSFEWNADRKVMAIRERVAEGIEVAGVGDWSSPIGIRYESQPVQANGQTLRIRRMYSVISMTSFQVMEELSVNGGPFVRLGNGDFRRKP